MTTLGRAGEVAEMEGLMRRHGHPSSLLSRAWRLDAPLTVTGIVMLAVLAVSAIGLAVDPRVVTNAPIWLKPAKFAVSIAIYAATALWAFTFLDEWRKTRVVVGWTTAITMIGEMAIILAQVARGTASHFNTSTALNATLWTVMGAAIVAQTIASIVLAVAVWRARFTDRAMGWAFRLGLTLSIVGALSAFSMTTPTAAQVETMRAGERPMTVGAHTVGAPDGGPGMIGTGWSTQHGDLRVPHFVGLHAFQALPLLAFVTRRRAWSETRRVRLTLAAAVSYALLFAVLVAQALRGASIAGVGGTSLIALGAWVGVSGIAIGLAFATSARVRKK